MQVGELAPSFTLPAANREGEITLEDYRGEMPLLLALFRGLYCPFCRRRISLLRPACESLRDAGVALLGVVIATPERARQYFRHFPACFPIAAAPDRSIHRAYGVVESTWTRELLQKAERDSARILREMGTEAPTGQATAAFIRANGFDVSAEDDAEMRRPSQSVGYFLVMPDGRIRLARVEQLDPVPDVDEILRRLTSP